MKAWAARLGWGGLDLPVVEGAPGTGQGTPLWAVPAPRGKAYVDFQNDVKVSDVELAAQEGYARA